MASAPDRVVALPVRVAEAPRTTALLLAIRLCAGDASPEVVAWVRAGLLRWAKSDGGHELSEVLHLSSSPRRFRQAVRDYWIGNAAEYVGGPPWAQARVLAAEAVVVRRKLPAWTKLDVLPADAPPVHVCLAHGAIVSGVDLPTTVPSWYRIIASQKGGTTK